MNKRANAIIAVLIIVLVGVFFFFRAENRPIRNGDYAESIFYSSKVGYVNNLDVKENYAYLVSPKNFLVLDISDKKNPFLVKSFPSDRTMIDVFIDGNYAYVGVGDLRFPNGGLKIFDISNPKNAIEIKNDLVLPESPAGLFVRDNVLFIGDYASGMIIVNVTDKRFPRIISRYDTTLPVNVSEYNSLLNRAKTDYAGFKQFVLDKYAYSELNAVKFDSIFERMGAENFITHLLVFSTYGAEPHAWWLIVRDNFAYVALDAYGMDIVDISDLSNPVKVGNIKKNEKGNEYFFNSVALSGDYAYIATDAHGLLVVDVSDPQNPKEVADVPAWKDTRWLKAGGHMVRAKIVDDILYMSATEDGLYIYNISEKTKPVLLQKFDKSVEANRGTDWALDVERGYIYTAYFNSCANTNKCSSANPKAQYRPAGGFEIFKIS